MKLEQQVISLEFAKKLEELGVKSQSHFAWRKYGLRNEPILMECDLDLPYQISTLSGELLWQVRAYSVAELGEMLPRQCVTQKLGDKWVCRNGRLDARSKEEAINAFVIPADTEADARAKMLIYLLENALITLC